MNYIFTIIIPHKNIPELLQRCLNSIPNRPDIQIIIVDDNSDSSIVNFAHFPGIGRSNTEIYFDKTNKGAGRARNIGLKHAKGEWLLFADSDDMFTEYFDEILDEILKDKDSDILYFDVESRDSVTLLPTTEADWYSLMVKNIATNGITSANKYTIMVPWAKAIRKRVIEKYNILFEEVQYSNDIAFSVKASYYANNVSAIMKLGYCWMFRQGSLWRERNINWYVTRMKVYVRIAKFLKKNKENAGYLQFANCAKSYMNGISSESKVQHLFWLVWFGISMKDVGVFYKQIPVLCLKYTKAVVSIIKRTIFR